MRHPTIEWFRQLIGSERAASLQETNDSFVAPIIPRQRFDDVADNPIPVYEDEGVYAIVGERGGRQDIVELHFSKAEGWSEDEVKDFLGQHGLDSEDTPTWGFTTETVTVETEEANVEETEEFFVIEGAHLTKSGVQKEKLRPREVFESAWMLYEGIPTTHGHPFPVVESMQQVTGMVRNVELGEAPEDEVFLVGDLYLAKESGVNGLDVTEANVEGNRTAFEAAQEGEAVQLSQGYLYQALDEEGEYKGEPYVEKLTEIVPNHEAILDPVTDEEAACSPEEGCGVNPVIEAAREALDVEAYRKVEAEDEFLGVPENPTFTTDEWEAPTAGDLDDDPQTFEAAHMLRDGPPEEFGSYDFPYRKSADGPVYVNALRAIRSSIGGARGGPPEGYSDETLAQADEAAERLLTQFDKNNEGEQTMACEGECNADDLRSSLEEAREAKASREAKLDGARERLSRLVDVEEEDDPSIETLLAYVERQVSDAETIENELAEAKADLAQEATATEEDLDRLDEDVEAEDRVEELKARSLPALREHCEMLQEKALVKELETKTDRRFVGSAPPSGEDDSGGGMGFLTGGDD